MDDIIGTNRKKKYKWIKQNCNYGWYKAMKWILDCRRKIIENRISDRVFVDDPHNEEGEFMVQKFTQN